MHKATLISLPVAFALGAAVLLLTPATSPNWHRKRWP